jgi:hypothetical protein
MVDRSIKSEEHLKGRQCADIPNFQTPSPEGEELYSWEIL